MSKTISLFLLIALLYYFGEIDACADCGKLYESPSNIKFPYGDEVQLNTDVSEPDTNKIICLDRPPLTPAQGRCPFPPEDPDELPLAFPYVMCPPLSHPTLPPNVPIVRLGPQDDNIPAPMVQCKTCDLKLTEDDSAVYLKCVNCHDLPSTENTANFTTRELMYKVYFIEIANYTTVEVSGKEHF